MGQFATGVTIVTAIDADGRKVGLTANSFNSVSMSPPLVLWSLSKAASSMEAFSTGSHYAINILGADQQELANQLRRRRAPPVPPKAHGFLRTIVVHHVHRTCSLKSERHEAPFTIRLSRANRRTAGQRERTC